MSADMCVDAAACVCQKKKKSKKKHKKKKSKKDPKKKKDDGGFRMSDFWGGADQAPDSSFYGNRDE